MAAEVQITQAHAQDRGVGGQRQARLEHRQRLVEASELAELVAEFDEGQRIGRTPRYRLAQPVQGRLAAA